MWYNSIIQWTLNSPLRSIVSHNMMLMSVVGCKTGRKYSFPVNYLRDDNTLYVISDRKRHWWRNLRGGATVTLLLNGRRVLAHGRILEDEFAVMDRLTHCFHLRPSYARSLRVRLANDGTPNAAALQLAAQEHVLIELHLGVERFTEEFQRVVG